MYEIIKDIIENKQYQLSDICNKINKLWLEYQLTDEQRDELIELANTNTSEDNEKPEFEKQLEALRDYLMNNIEPRIQALEESASIDLPIAEEYPAWVPYDGVVNLGYDFGAKVTHNGFKWENMLEGTKNVWEPGAIGVDERYWKKVEE